MHSFTHILTCAHFRKYTCTHTERRKLEEKKKKKEEEEAEEEGRGKTLSSFLQGKRVAETMCYSYAKEEKVEVRVARIFNTFGPR